ncbi:MAG: DUF6566 family protein [Pseudomonadota bacterium]
MSGYPVLQHEGYCASVSTKKLATGRWTSSVSYARGNDAASLQSENVASHRVPNDYPTQEKALLAAYEHARVLISKELVKQ